MFIERINTGYTLKGAVLASTIALAACQPSTPEYFRTVGVTGPAGDACGASAYAYLIGQPETLLAGTNFLPAPRIIHPGEAVTMDHVPSRMNIRIDVSGRIADVYCG